MDNRVDKLLSLLQEHNVPVEAFPLGWLLSTDFFTAPAARLHHSAYPGGLFDHSYKLTLKLLEWTENGSIYGWSRSFSPIIVGMLHDVTKIGFYEPDSLGGYRYSDSYENLGGHGKDSVMKLMNQNVYLTEEEMLCIRYHMGAYETDDWDSFDVAIRAYPNVLWTHMADMYSSKLMEEEPQEVNK